uniref:Uncharacterized protein n=1 Tax=Tanacetum cinerariifolium TaxID=118510 RepID=A0A6L2LG99_TANCI|nr:hypothetical protein [Tanacetum cinerariifolium]
MLLGKLKTSPRVLAYLDNKNMTLLETLDFTVHDLDKVFNEVQFFRQLGFHPVEFKMIGNGSYFSNDLKRSNITRVQLSLFAKTYHPFPWRYFQHDLISYLKLKMFSSYIGIALLTITSGLDTDFDLNYFLVRLVVDHQSNELTISNFSPTDR